MRTKIFLPAICILMVTACNGNRAEQQPVPETPKALEDNNDSYKLISKRGTDDLVESLYNGLVSQDTVLRQLEAKLDALGQSKNDSTDPFHQFDQKSVSYYKTASQHINSINDSLLKNKIQNMVESHQAKYNITTAKHKELLKMINSKSIKLDDLHSVLKIVKTLPLIEKYQKDKLPGTLSLERYIKKQDEAIENANKIAGQ